jgi:hypothetical protein
MPLCSNVTCAVAFVFAGVATQAAAQSRAGCYTRAVPEPDAANPAQDTCPICGSENDCGLAAGDSTCWCFTAAIPPAALERIPDAARNRRCICAACAGQAGAAPASPVET